MTAKQPVLPHLMPILTRVHDHLEADIDLDALADLFGYSPFHFHRLFSTTLGETPKRHVERLRLERARYLLAVTDHRVLDIALNVGFNSHETFSRAFKRLTGTSPVQYRKRARQAQAERAHRNRTFRGDGCTLSEVAFVSLAPTPLLAIRRLGSYESLPTPSFPAVDGLWRRLAAHATHARVAFHQQAWVICYDDPNVTPGPAQRLDACLPVATVMTEQGEIRNLRFPGGRFARIRHLGPLDTVDQAYRNLADGIRRSGTLTFDSGPPLQIFRAVQINNDPECNHTEVYFPVKPA